VLLSLDDRRSQLKVEIIVERDDLVGDSNQIEISVHPYRDGQPEPMPVVPRLILSMNQEKDVWKLSEITLALRVPLSDPEYLKGLQKTQNSSFENSAIAGIRTINTAEVTYSASYPEQGYTCKLSQLGGTGSNPSREHAMLIDETLASSKKDEYTFAIRNCDTRPASRYWAVAVPIEPDSDLRAFCSDESGAVRYATDGKATTCVSQGVPLN